MRHLTLLALGLLAACSTVQPPRGQQNQFISSANFADTDPHDWERTKPSAYPVHGIDLSKFQTSVDWENARANGVNFAFIKATEGGDQTDPLFDSHWQNAGRAGVARGAYHFYYHCRPASEQARWFISHVPRTPGALPPVLDMEWTPRSPTCRTRRAPETIRAEAKVFLDAIAKHYKTKPILYTAIDFYEDNELWRLENTEFWLRSTAAHPRDLYTDQPWTFWQYTSTGRATGIEGPLDLNAFAGSKTAWLDWRDSRSQK